MEKNKHFRSEKEAKEYAVKKTCTNLSEKEAQNRIREYQSYLKSTICEEDIIHWKKRIKELEKLLNNDNLKKGSILRELTGYCLN